MFKDWFQKKKYATISVYSDEQRKPDNALANKVSRDKENKCEPNVDNNNNKNSEDQIWSKCNSCNAFLIRT